MIENPPLRGEALERFKKSLIEARIVIRGSESMPDEFRRAFSRCAALIQRTSKSFRDFMSAWDDQGERLAIIRRNRDFLRKGGRRRRR